MPVVEFVLFASVALLVAGIVFVNCWTTTYHTFARLLNGVSEARGVLASCLRLRRDLIEDLNRLLRIADDKDDIYQRRVIDAWERVNHPAFAAGASVPANGPLAPFNEMFSRGGPKVSVNIPDRKAEDTRQKLMDKLENVETRIGAAERMTESTVREYNNALCGVFASTVAWFHGFHPLPFTALTEDRCAKPVYDFGDRST